jgi:hypothetical protein
MTGKLNRAKISRMQVKVEDVLVWVNSQREQRNLPALKNIPKGERKSLNRCPLALALSCDEQPIHIASWGWWRPYPKDMPKAERLPLAVNEIPDFVAEFLRQFDTGVAFREYTDAI